MRKESRPDGVIAAKFVLSGAAAGFGASCCRFNWRSRDGALIEASARYKLFPLRVSDQAPLMLATATSKAGKRAPFWRL